MHPNSIALLSRCLPLVYQEIRVAGQHLYCNMYTVSRLARTNHLCTTIPDDTEPRQLRAGSVVVSLCSPQNRQPFFTTESSASSRPRLALVKQRGCTQTRLSSCFKCTEALQGESSKNRKRHTSPAQTSRSHLDSLAVRNADTFSRNTDPTQLMPTFENRHV